MYPFLRMVMALARAGRQPGLGFLDTHVDSLRCWPWDLDPWAELNNGRTLTLFDLGRVPLARRNGLAAVLRANGWRMTVAGASIRYRRRVTLMARLTQKARVLGWDARFFYLEQSMWQGNDCTSHVLIRSAALGPGGMLPPATVVAALGLPPESPPLPAWVQAWAGAEAERPWPPAP